SVNSSLAAPYRISRAARRKFRLSQRNVGFPRAGRKCRGGARSQGSSKAKGVHSSREWLKVKKMAEAPSSKPPRKPLSPAAQRALAEAEARRQAAATAAQQPAERDGRGGLDPV